MAEISSLIEACTWVDLPHRVDFHTSFSHAVPDVCVERKDLLVKPLQSKASNQFCTGGLLHVFFPVSFLPSPVPWLYQWECFAAAAVQMWLAFIKGRENVIPLTALAVTTSIRSSALERDKCLEAVWFLTNLTGTAPSYKILELYNLGSDLRVSAW